MTHPSLAAVDLNLLVAFQALWEERSVTRAGRKLGLSQPATSGALSRLRKMLRDPLFVRGRGGLVPTERCTALAGPLSQALRDIQSALAGTSFDPATTDRRMTIGGVDAAIAVIVPHLAGRFAREAPHAHLSVHSIDPARAVDLVEAGALDVALSPRVRPSSTVKQKVLFPLDFCIALRPEHPLARAAPNPLALRKYPRLQVAFDGGPPSAGPFGVEPALTLSSFLAVPHVLTDSDAWAVLPLPFAKRLARLGVLVAKPLPPQVPKPKLAMRMLWPETHDASPASRWLRGLVVDAVASAEARGA